MRIHSVRILIVAVAAVLLQSRAALAQAQPSDVLNTVELRQLVERAAPADHVRLRAHFEALAERYRREAIQHERMAQASAGQPAKSSNVGLVAHCRSLAKADRELEKGAQALAAFHGGRAAGASVPPPANTRGLESGVGATKPSAAELDEFAEKAAKANDHRALADYFATLAGRYTADADAHTGMATLYGSNSRLAGMAPHCERLAKTARGAATEASTAAAMHKELLGAAR
jgi:hypothetical protein